MIEENTPAETRRRMDIGLENVGGSALQIESKVALPIMPEIVRQTMRLDGMETLEIQKRLDEALAGGIALDHGRDIGAQGTADFRISRKCAAERVEQKLA